MRPFLRYRSHRPRGANHLSTAANSGLPLGTVSHFRGRRPTPIRPGWLPRLRHPAEQGLAPVLIVAVAAVVQQPEALARICTISPICFKDTLPPTAHGIVRSNSTELNQLDLAAVTCAGAVVLPFVNHRTEPADVLVRHKPGGQSSGPHHQGSGEAKIRESTAGVSRKPSYDGKARGCSSKHLSGLTAWNT